MPKQLFLIGGAWRNDSVACCANKQKTLVSITRQQPNYTVQATTWGIVYTSIYMTSMKIKATRSLFPSKIIGKHRNVTKYCTTKQGPNSRKPQNCKPQLTMNHQHQNHYIRTDSSQNRWEVSHNSGDKIITHDIAVVRARNVYNSRGG